jgi:hypothetical protein
MVQRGCKEEGSGRIGEVKPRGYDRAAYVSYLTGYISLDTRSGLPLTKCEAGRCRVENGRHARPSLVADGSMKCGVHEPERGGGGS